MSVEVTTIDYAEYYAEFKRRTADAVIKREATLILFRYAESRTLLLRLMRGQMVRALRELGVQTPIYFVAHVDPRRRLLGLTAFAGKNRVRLGREWRRKSRDPLTWRFA